MSAYFEVLGARARAEADRTLVPWSPHSLPPRELTIEAPAPQPGERAAPTAAASQPQLPPAASQGLRARPHGPEGSPTVPTVPPTTSPAAVVVAAPSHAAVSEDLSRTDPVTALTTQRPPDRAYAPMNALDLALTWVSSPDAPRDDARTQGASAPLDAEPRPRGVPPVAQRTRQGAVISASTSSLSIGSIEIRVSPPPAKVPPLQRLVAAPPPSPPAVLAQGFTSTFGLRQR